VRRAQPGSSNTTGIRGWSLCFQAGEAVRALAVPVIGKARVEPVVDTPWNTRQVRIVDPDGRLLVFTQPYLDPQLMERIRLDFEADKSAAT